MNSEALDQAAALRLLDVSRQYLATNHADWNGKAFTAWFDPQHVAAARTVQFLDDQGELLGELPL